MINSTKRSRFLVYGGLVLAVIVAPLPYYWVIRTSMLPNAATAAVRSPWTPFEQGLLTLEPYLTMWDNYNFALYFRNSIVVSVSATILALVFGIPGAYAFARLDFPGRQVLFYTVVFTIMFPWIVITVPVYGVFDLGLLNSLVGVIRLLQGFLDRESPRTSRRPPSSTGRPNSARSSASSSH